jgi:hypothetical protein
MTFGEIYTRVAFMVWGNSNPPAGSSTILTGDEGIIAQVHKDIMREYNYWFMHETTAINTVVNQNSYTLPTDYKELVEVQFKTNGEEYFQEVMTHMPMRTAQKQWWIVNNNSQEYATHYEISGESIIIYPKPSEIREMHFCYWKFLTGPTTAFTDGTNTETNDLTANAGEAIAYMSASNMLEMLDEFQKSVIYAQKGIIKLEQLKTEDKRRRSKFEDLDYRSF